MIDKISADLRKDGIGFIANLSAPANGIQCAPRRKAVAPYYAASCSVSR